MYYIDAIMNSEIWRHVDEENNMQVSPLLIDLALLYNDLPLIHGEEDRSKPLISPGVLTRDTFYGYDLVKLSPEKPDDAQLTDYGKTISIDTLTTIALHAQELDQVLEFPGEENKEVYISDIKQRTLLQRREVLKKILTLSGYRIGTQVDDNVINEAVESNPPAILGIKDQIKMNVPFLRKTLYREVITERIKYGGDSFKNGYNSYGVDFAQHLLIENHHHDMRDTAEGVDNWLRGKS
jgi:hypothetical protein